MRRGFTLVELLVVLALATLLAATAVPAWQQQSLRAARTDAVAALLRVQAQQERHRQQIGWYASSLSALGSAPTSTQGRYRLEVRPRHADAYVAIAEALGPQAGDRECATLTLEVAHGFARPGPSARCWNR